MKKDIIFKDECYKIISACFNLYNDKGCGFLEPVYQERLEIEFEYLEIPAIAQPELNITYRDKKLNKTYRPDFICYDKIIIEIKTVSELTDEHRAQVINYLNATGFKLGLLINFGHYPKLQWERIVNTHKNKI